MDENGYLLAESHSILNKWKNYFSQLLNVHNVSDVRQIEVHTAEPGPSRLEVKIAIAKFKTYTSPGSDEIPSELIQAAGEMLLPATHKLITLVRKMEELPDQWKESIIVTAHKKGDTTECNNFRVISLLST
jgi:hypothetical protein